MGRVSTYTLLEDISSYSKNDCVGIQIPVKYIPSKTYVPLKQTEMLEDEKGK